MSGNMLSRKEVKKILIIRWGSLGDLALCSAIFQDVYEQFPQAEIHLMVDPVWAPLFEGDPRFSQLITYRIRGVPFWDSVKNWLKLMRSEKYDLSIDLQNNDRSRFLQIISWSLFMAPKWRVSTTGNFPFNVKTAPISRDMYALEVLRVPLEALNLAVNHNKPVLYSSLERQQQAKRLLEDFRVDPGSYIIFVPGSSQSGYKKRWGDSNYIELGRQLVKSNKIDKIVLLGAKSDQALCQRIETALGEACVDLSGRTELGHITTLVSLSKGVIANDTGIAHIAASQNVPIAVICGPTLASRVKPAGDNVITFQVPVDCFSELQPEECMKQVTAEMVFKELVL